MTENVNEIVEKMKKLGLVDDEHITHVYAMLIDFILDERW